MPDGSKLRGEGSAWLLVSWLQPHGKEGLLASMQLKTPGSDGLADHRGWEAELGRSLKGKLPELYFYHLGLVS